MLVWRVNRVRRVSGRRILRCWALCRRSGRGPSLTSPTTRRLTWTRSTRACTSEMRTYTYMYISHTYRVHSHLRVFTLLHLNKLRWIPRGMTVESLWYCWVTKVEYLLVNENKREPSDLTHFFACSWESRLNASFLGFALVSSKPALLYCIQNI